MDRFRRRTGVSSPTPARHQPPVSYGGRVQRRGGPTSLLPSPCGSYALAGGAFTASQIAPVSMHLRSWRLRVAAGACRTRSNPSTAGRVGTTETRDARSGRRRGTERAPEPGESAATVRAKRTGAWLRESKRDGTWRSTTDEERIRAESTREKERESRSGCVGSDRGSSFEARQRTSEQPRNGTAIQTTHAIYAKIRVKSTRHHDLSLSLPSGDP